MTHMSVREDRVQTFMPSKRYTVLFLIDRLHSTEGGAEGVVQKLCRSLQAIGIRCLVVTFWAGKGVAGRFSCPVQVIPLSSLYGWSSLRCAKSFASLLRLEQVDIVHTFFPASDLWGGLVARLSGCPIVISSRRDMGIIRSRKHQFLYPVVNRIFSQVHAVSEKVREFCITQDRIPAEKVITVYNGVDLDAIDAAVPENRESCFGANVTQPVVSTIANIRHVKGIDILVEAAARVVKEVPDVIFAVIGGTLQEQAYWEAVQNSIACHHLERNFRCLGTRTDVYALLKQSDIFCLPSRSEGMSNALLEAMACSLPCVVTAVGGNTEVMVDDLSGFLVPSEDWEALAARILMLLRDPVRRRQMGQEARRVVESKFTLRQMTARLNAVYADLLGKRGLISLSETDSTSTSHEGDRSVALTKQPSPVSTFQGL